MFGYTRWRGSAFDCPRGEIILRHRFFSLDGEDSEAGVCNNGSIVGQSLRVQDGQYSSQLNVTVTADMIGRSVECVYADGGNSTIVGSLNVTSSGKKSKSTG